ncbi:NaeI family type II restriction endonuclease [Kocuria rhizophila]|uniref:NaeI family type II restriction endonuclease n=1 Tax=Kocuria rhizophila TaxID=72000 RepID=UPI0009E8092D|nr:NaeI family type II restriction endonuclease [Kocuria rhizophila]
MSETLFGPFEKEPSPTEEFDVAADEVLNRLHELDPDGSETAQVFRTTFDQLYDGQHTGRYKVDQLFKTEKTHFGTLIEINLQRRFGFQDGTTLDYKIAGHEVDCKYSHTGGWMLPLESYDQLVIVTQADDLTSTWSMGVVRVSEKNRRTSSNRDRKTGLNKYGRQQIIWLHDRAEMPPNALLKLTPSTVDHIMKQSSGQKRVNELFRQAQNHRLTRNVIATVAQQDDFMKRVRHNGGARSILGAEGYLILGGDYSIQRNTAAALKAQVPHRGEFVCVRVARSSDPSDALINGENWRIATENDVVPEAVPILPAK